MIKKLQEVSTPADFSLSARNLSAGAGSHTPIKKIFLETYGCQMNEYDSELIRAILAKADYTFVKDEADADVIMLNTCAIRENAHRKIYGRVYDILHKRRMRDDGRWTS